jgi:hypothetical protein
MISLRTFLYTTLIVLTNAIRHTLSSPVPAWYSIWKIRAGVPGTKILDAAERHGILRGYNPPHSEDPHATGINSYVANLIQSGYFSK